MDVQLQAGDAGGVQVAAGTPVQGIQGDAHCAPPAVSLFFHCIISFSLFFSLFYPLYFFSLYFFSTVRRTPAAVSLLFPETQ